RDAVEQCGLGCAHRRSCGTDAAPMPRAEHDSNVPRADAADLWFAGWSPSVRRSVLVAPARRSVRVPHLAVRARVSLLAGADTTDSPFVDHARARVPVPAGGDAAAPPLLGQGRGSAGSAAGREPARGQRS